jgi:hypothetical protein
VDRPGAEYYALAVGVSQYHSEYHSRTGLGLRPYYSYTTEAESLLHSRYIACYRNTVYDSVMIRRVLRTVQYVYRTVVPGSIIVV